MIHIVAQWLIKVSDVDFTPLETSAQPVPVPVMHREKFAELVGVSVDVVNGWINRGYLPTFEVGKYRLVNLALLSKLAMEKEFRL